MFKVKKTEKIETENLSSLETENSTQPRKSIFFTLYSFTSKIFTKKKIHAYI